MNGMLDYRPQKDDEEEDAPRARRVWYGIALVGLAVGAWPALRSRGGAECGGERGNA